MLCPVVADSLTDIVIIHEIVSPNIAIVYSSSRTSEGQTLVDFWHLVLLVYYYWATESDLVYYITCIVSDCISFRMTHSELIRSFDWFFSFDWPSGCFTVRPSSDHIILDTVSHFNSQQMLVKNSSVFLHQISSPSIQTLNIQFAMYSVSVAEPLRWGAASFVF